MITRILIKFHWPHDRFALGWETIAADEEFPYHTVTLYLLFMTIDFNF